MRIKLFLVSIFLLTASAVTYAKPALYGSPVTIQFIAQYANTSFQNMTTTNFIMSAGGAGNSIVGILPSTPNSLQSPITVPNCTSSMCSTTVSPAFYLVGPGRGPTPGAPGFFNISYLIYPAGSFAFTVQVNPDGMFVQQTSQAQSIGLASCQFTAIGGTTTLNIMCWANNS